MKAPDRRRQRKRFRGRACDKLGIGDAILLKAVDTLTLYEMLEYKKHPIRGQAALDSNDP